MNVTLFGRDAAENIPLPQTAFSRSAYNYLFPILKEGSKKYIANIETDARLLAINDLYLPVTINDTQWNNSYVCSPFTHYILYATEELVRLPSPFLRGILRMILALLGLFLKFGKLNKVVIVNNWMLSTNLYPECSAEEIRAATEYIRERFPTHAIIWRSIQTYKQKDLRAIFRREDYLEIPSRQVYLWDETNPVNESPHGRRDLAADEKLLLDSKYDQEHVDDLSAEKARRVCQLYNLLYINKYSRFNPQFTDEFFIHAVSSGVFDVTVLRKDGQIEGVVGLLPLERMATATIFGYNTELPAEEKLYRRLSIIALLYARTKHWISHASSGAASFKRNRKYVSEIEYSMVYIRHIPLRQRLAWQTLSVLINRIGIPLLKKYEL
jgi:hypothetical protein